MISKLSLALVLMVGGAVGGPPPPPPHPPPPPTTTTTTSYTPTNTTTPTTTCPQNFLGELIATVTKALHYLIKAVLGTVLQFIIHGIETLKNALDKLQATGEGRALDESANRSSQATQQLSKLSEQLKSGKLQNQLERAFESSEFARRMNAAVRKLSAN